MVTRAIERITSWSYSRWKEWMDCPYKAKLKFIEKRKESGNTAMERGNDIHKLAENYVKGYIRTLPKELALFKEEFAHLRKVKASAELTFAFKKDWSPTTYDDWNNCVVRIKVDAITPPIKKSVTIIDHKTGSPRPGYDEQLELYALGAFLAVPQAEEARTNLWYLDKGVIVGADAERKKGVKPEGIFKREQLPVIIKAWEDRVAPMLADTRFKPKPNAGCEWCHFRKSNGGPCKY